MVDTFTPNKLYDLQTIGGNSGTWGNINNDNFSIIDNNLGTVTTLALTNTNVTLNATQAESLAFILTGTLTGNVDIIFPTGQGGFYKILNKTIASTFYVRLYISGAAGLIICAPPSNSNFVDVITDGADFYYCGLGSTGIISTYPSTALPAWVTNCTVQPYLYCDGSSFNGSTYRQLRDILGGTTLPDLKGRGQFYYNDGTGRITTANCGINGNTLFAAGGADGVVLDTTQIPAHLHGITDPGHTHRLRANSGTANQNLPTNRFLAQPSPNIYADTDNVNMAVASAASNTTGITQTQNTGGGLVHTNMPPALIAGIPIIKT